MFHKISNIFILFADAGGFDQCTGGSTSCLHSHRETTGRSCSMHWPAYAGQRNRKEGDLQ